MTEEEVQHLAASSSVVSVGSDRLYKINNNTLLIPSEGWSIVKVNKIMSGKRAV